MYEELKHLARSNCHTDGAGNLLKLFINRKHSEFSLSFKSKPPAHIRGHLRFNGFRWSRKSKRWKSYLNNTQVKRIRSVYKYINKNK